MINYVVKHNGIIKVKDFEVIDNETVGLQEDMFLNKDEIVYDIINARLSDDDKNYFKAFSKDDIIMEHLGFGMWIRNTYALWDKANPMTAYLPEDSDKHPDCCSNDIIELVVDTLNGNYTPKFSNPDNNFNEAMKNIGS